MDTFRRLKEFYWPHKRFFIYSILSLAFVAAITVVYPIVLQMTIDDVIVAGKYDLIPWIAAAFVVLMVVKGITQFIHQYTGDLFGIKSVRDMRDALYSKLQRLSFTYYDNAKTGDIMSRLTADVEGFRFFLSFGFAELLRIVLLVGFSLAVMFSYSVPLTFVTMAAMPFLVIVVYRFEKKVHPAFRGIRKSLGRLNTRVQENISGMHTVKSLSKEGFEVERFTTNNVNYRDNYLNTASIWSRFFPLMELIGNISAVLLLAFGGYLVIEGTVRLGELVAFFSLVWYLLGPLMGLGFVINMFSQSKASGERLTEILDAKEDIVEVENPIDQPIKGDVEFVDVTFSYIAEDDDALKNIKLHAKQGSTIGIIGATGSGKTSLTHLMSRFYEAEKGQVLIDGHPVQDYALKGLRQHIGFVLQESFLFSMSIRDNIAYGNPEASDEDIIDAAKRAQAHDFIMKMPKAYDTMLGERGMGLSGGQKQRIAIARAICLNPSILVLDDATSAVDMDTEFKIQQALKEVMKDRTSFIISHRISSLKHADEIIVLDKGEIKERGSHQQLMAQKGIYKQIYDIQYQDRDMVMEYVDGEGGVS